MERLLIQDPKPSFDVNISSEKLMLYQFAIALYIHHGLRFFIIPFRPPYQLYITEQFCHSLLRSSIMYVD